MDLKKIKQSSTLLLVGLALCFIAAYTQIKQFVPCSVTDLYPAYVPVHNATAMQEGYVLIAPYAGKSSFEESGKVQLIDDYGRVSHEWETKYQPLYAVLQKDGSLFVTMTTPSDLTTAPGGGKTGLIEHLDWKGNLLWQYENESMHHDFDVLPNGDIVVLEWEKSSPEFASKIKGGIDDKTGDITWTDRIAVINKLGEETWSWSAKDHLNPQDYELSTYTPRSEFTHGNSVRYVEQNPLTKTPAFLVSFRHLNQVVMVDAKSGDILWKSPKGKFAFQHDATLTPKGNVLVFDNGFFRQQTRPFLWSRALEIDPRTDTIVWSSVNDSAEGTERAQFASSIQGGSQRLENGNTLITLSTQNRIVEVTPDRKVVWSYTAYPQSSGGSQEIIFKARKYSPEGTVWGGYIPRYTSIANDLFCR